MQPILSFPAALILTLLIAESVGAIPELILYNGKILTVDKQFSTVEAVAIRDGRIVETGRSQALRALAGEGTRLIDLAGQTVIPGLIDNHMHLIRGSRRWRNQVRLDGITSYQAALARIGEKARSLAPGEWILGLGGFIEKQFLDQPEGFRRIDLDAAAPDNPVYLQHLFDWGYVNSAALREIGIDASRPQQKRPGLLLDERGLPDGAVTLATQQAITERIEHLPVDAPEQDAMRMLADLNAVGLTMVLDVGGFDMREHYYRPFVPVPTHEIISRR